MVIIIFSLILDYSVFKISDDTSYCEIYYSVGNNLFTYIKEKDGYAAYFNLKIEMKNLSTGWLSTTEIPKTILTQYPSEPTSNTVDFIPLFLLSNYNFLVKIVIIDSISGRKDSSSIIINSPIWKGLSISSIQITNMVITDRKTIFEKNGLNLIPLPERFFTIETPLLTYYSEVYGLESDTTIINISVFQNNNLVKMIKEEKIIDSLKSRLIAGSFNLLGLSDGEYILKIEVKNNNNTVKSQKSFKLQKIKKEGFIKRLRQEEKEIALFLDYLLPQEELSLYKLMSDSEKIDYAEKYWLRQDPNPLTSENEAFREFLKRVDYADKNFPEKLRKGRYSARGRICIKYGIPNEVIQRSFESGYTPYQIWQYNIENPISFLFVDKSNIGVYELVFSSLKNEPIDKNFIANWRKYIMEEDVFTVIGLSDYIHR